MWTEGELGGLTPTSSRLRSLEVCILIKPDWDAGDNFWDKNEYFRIDKLCKICQILLILYFGWGVALLPISCGCAKRHKFIN